MKAQLVLFIGRTKRIVAWPNISDLFATLVNAHFLST